MTKEDGMARAARNANPLWRAEADRAVLRAARTLPQLTTDDVISLMNPNVSTHENRALGPVMRDAAKANWIEKSTKPNVNCATRKNNHSRPLQVWRSLLYKGKKS